MFKNIKYLSKLFLLILLLAFSNFLQAENIRPNSVFEYHLKQLLPKILKIAHNKNIQVKQMIFKEGHNLDIKPDDCYLLISMNYKLLKKYFNLPAINFTEKIDLVPGDVMHLSKKINKILSKFLTDQTFVTINREPYKQWRRKYRKDVESISPSDVFYLNIYFRSILLDL